VKFQVNRDVFSDAVSFAVKLLPQRTTLPILSGVLIEADADGLTLSSFDYEVSAQTSIAAEVDEPGTILVSGRLLADIANRLPNAPVTFSTDENRIAVSCGSANFSLLSMPVEEYPTLPTVGERSGVVPGDGDLRRRRVPRRRHSRHHGRPARGHRERALARRHRPLPRRRPRHRVRPGHGGQHRDDDRARPGPHPAGGRQDLRQRQHRVGLDHGKRRQRTHRVPGR
jgi:hypothetical protein